MTAEVLKTGGAGVPLDSNQGEPSERPTRRRWVWLAVIIVIAGAATAYKMRARSRAAAAGLQGQSDAPAVSIGVSPVEKKDVPYYLTGLGSVTAFNTVTVRSRVDGQLVKIYFQEGQFVHEGEPLAEIDPRPFQVALEQAEGQLAKDLALQADAKKDLGRYQQLWQEGVIARQQLDTQMATVGQYEGIIQSDRAQIDNQKLQLTYCRIAAPLSGRVGLRLVDQGNMVHATDANGMLVITQVQPIAMIFTIPEDNLQEVASQVGRRRELIVEAYSRDDKTKLADGKLLTIDNEIDQTTGTVKLKAVFDNHGLSLWPNQFVNVRLILSMRKDAVVISPAAIQRGAQGSFVYVVKSNNTAEVRPVQVDFIQGNLAVIRDGLVAGELVVTDGQDKLQSGTKVSFRPVSTTRAPTTPSSQGPSR